MGDPSTFSIVNVTGQEPMELKLRGRALPYRPIDFEGTMRADFSWYPGNAVASIQMLGAEEKSTAIRGMWKDKFVKQVTDNGIPISNSGIALFNELVLFDTKAIADAVDKMRLSGQLLHVEWDDFVRVGILMRFRQTWHRREDMEWEMEFQWVSRGEVQTPAVLPLSATPQSFAEQLRAGVDRLVAAMQPPSFPVVEQFTSQIDALISEIDDACIEVENAVQSSIDQIISPIDAAERTLAATETVVTASSQIVGIVESFPPLDIIKSVALPTPGDADVEPPEESAFALSASPIGLGAALVSTTYARGIKGAARALELTSTEQADTLRSTVRQETLLASFVARGPMDLRDISQKYYNTPDAWRRLLSFNNLDSSRVQAGSLILVPKIMFEDRGT